ncbi:DegT/DnrJ/EryC1/StrS family aminotransferase [Alcaligenaceae bacterium]|nr:DegT/DnrJ/EryC1/StrS family aminotransferase [Alcaligenaceae bacterium]
MIKFLDLHAQYLSIQTEIDQAMAKVMADSSYIGGAVVEQFEDSFAQYQQAAYCVSVGNGTDAIEIVLEAFGFVPGSEVIVPANTFIASSEAITRSGYKVVFADVDPLTYTLDLADVRRRLSSRTAAIIAVHLYGHPCDMHGLEQLAKEHGLKIIEDCAQAHGAEYQGRRVGAIGDAGTFSFYPGKNLGAYGDGGAITTNDADLAQRCRMIANHGRLEKYNHLFEGRNSRLDGLQAAVLSVKLKHLDAWVEHRNQVAAYYLSQLTEVENLVLPQIASGCRHAFHLFVVRSKDREGLAEFLKEKGIQTGVHYPIALPKLEAYQYLGAPDPMMFANQADQQVLSLPIGEHLHEQQILTVTEAVKEFCMQRAIA